MFRFLLLALPAMLIACQPDPAAELPEVDAGAIERAVDATPADAPLTKLNLNMATEEEFKALGIGDRMAHEFDEYRPYASIREFRQKIGKYINDDPDQLAEYERMVFVPIDPNASDAETVGQLPGLDLAAAQTLVAERPFADDEAFLTRYAELATGGDRDAAAIYLARE